MIRTILLLAAAAILLPAAARAQEPCSLLAPDQIKAVLNSPVEPGQPGVAKDSNDCTWSDANGRAPHSSRYAMRGYYSAEGRSEAKRND